MATQLFNPGGVQLGNPTAGGAGNTPYLPTKPMPPIAAPKPSYPTPTPGSGVQQGGGPQGVVGAQSVRATQGGPFDSAYRQNLATYSGGQMARPGGNLTFDPTATPGAPTSLFGDLGGSGPTDLLSQALGFGGVSVGPQASTASSTKKPAQSNPLQWWGNQFNRNGQVMNA